MKRKVNSKTPYILKLIQKMPLVNCVRDGESLSPCMMKSSRDVNSYFFNEILKDTIPAVEEFWVINLNARGSVIGACCSARGSVDQCPISPKEVFCPAIHQLASSVILIHNHPSGDPSPSSEDRLLTVKMVEAGRLLGVRVLDHMIVGEVGRYFSFKDEGLI